MFFLEIVLNSYVNTKFLKIRNSTTTLVQVENSNFCDKFVFFDFCIHVYILKTFNGLLFIEKAYMCLTLLWKKLMKNILDP